MATNFPIFHPITVRASASDAARRRNISFPPPAASNNWWGPIFGWSSSSPDYLDSSNQDNPQPDPARSRLSSPGGFTEEKARRLRLMTTGSETFHDVMYHSAIASRLASDFSRPSNR